MTALRAALGVLLALAAGPAQAVSLDELLGSWHSPSGSLIEVRKRDAASAEGVMREPSPEAESQGFSAGERVIDEIRVEGDTIRMVLVYRAAGCQPARVQFRGRLREEGFAIAGEVDYGRFEDAGGTGCKYTARESFQPLWGRYSRLADPGPLRFVAREASPAGPGRFVKIDALTYGETFYVEATLDAETPSPLTVIVSTSFGPIQVELRRVAGGLHRSMPLTVVPENEMP